MTKTKTTINKKYKKKKVYVKIGGVIQNPETLRQAPLDFECRIDTGFDGGIFVPHWYRSDAKSIDVEPRITNITLADGSKIPAYVCAAYLQKIDECNFPPPGKPVVLVMCGRRKGRLLGLDALQYCTLLLDGPNQTFTMNI